MPALTMMESKETPAADLGVSRPGLTDLEVEVIDLFVGAVKLLGVPKSVGEIYGLLFISPEPLTQDALSEKLRLSKGSASQGLKMLRAIGAVKIVYSAGDRRDHYTAETELKELAVGFIRQQVAPRVESGGMRLERLKSLADKLADDNHAEICRRRITKLNQWHNRARELAPVLSTILE